MTGLWTDRPGAWTVEVDEAYRKTFGLPRPTAEPAVGPAGAEVSVNASALVTVADDLAQLLSPADAQVLRRRVEDLVAGPWDSEAVSRELESFRRIAGERGLLESFFRMDPRSPRRDFGDFIDAANNRADGARTVVFVATTPYFVISRESLYLRRNGFRTYLICAAHLPPAIKAFFEDVFDGVADGCNSGRIMRGLVRQLRPTLFHVQCWMLSYVLGGLVLRNRGQTPVICEFYDVTSIYGSREVLAELWGEARIDLDLAMESLILDEADGLVHRFPQREVKAWGGRRGNLPLNIEMHSYVCPEYVRYRDDKPSKRDGVIRLVYAGGLVPQTADHPRTIYAEANQPQTFRMLLEQGFALEVRHSPYRPIVEGDPTYQTFVELEREYACYRLHDGVLPDRLPGVIAGYDFGLILCDMDLSILRLNPGQMRGGFGTKFFTYLEAGLPVIVNAEYDEMARLVNEWGVGLSIASSEIPNLAERLKSFDYDGAVANIRRLNREFGMDTQIHRLIGLYEQAVAKRGAKASG